MPNNSTPATVVILARLDAAITKEGFGILAEGVRRTGAVVTWVADGATLDRITDGGGEWGWALALDRAESDSRQGLRQHLKSLRHTAVDAVVVPDGVEIVHRDLLVEAGIHTAVVDRFDDLPRGNRRPAPEGWACRSLVWGLWEVAATPPRPGSLLGRLLPWVDGPAAGSLTVTPPGAGEGVHAAADRVTRFLGAYRAGRQPTRLVRLGDLPAMLGSGCQPTGGSVLRAA